MQAIFILGITVIVLALTAHFLGPKEFWKKELIDVLINRATIAFTITLSIFGLSLLVQLLMPLSLFNSKVGMVIDFFTFLPWLIPYGIGYSEGEFLFYLAVGIEVLILTATVGVLIPARWIEKMKKKMKNVAQHRL